MPHYTISDGRHRVTVESDSPPTEEQKQKIFAGITPGSAEGRIPYEERGGTVSVDPGLPKKYLDRGGEFPEDRQEKARLLMKARLDRDAPMTGKMGVLAPAAPWEMPTSMEDKVLGKSVMEWDKPLVNLPRVYPPKEAGPIEKGAAGLFRGAEGLTEGLTTPSNLALILGGGMGQAGMRILAAALAAQATESAPEGVRGIAEAAGRGEVGDVAEQATLLGGQAAMAGGMMRHSYKAGQPVKAELDPTPTRKPISTIGDFFPKQDADLATVPGPSQKIDLVRRADSLGQREFFKQKMEEAGIESTNDVPAETLKKWSEAWRSEHPLNTGRESLGEKAPLRDAWNKYDETGELTHRDLVNEVEGLAKDGQAPERLLDAVERYRQAQEEDRALAGRGDMDSAEAEFNAELKRSLGEAEKPPQTPGIERQGGQDASEAPHPSIAPVKSAIDKVAGKDNGIEVYHDPADIVEGRGVEGRYDENGQIRVNSAFAAVKDVRAILREEWGHQAIATPQGQARLAEFMEKNPLTPAQQAELREAGYHPRSNETPEQYRQRLHDEFISKSGAEMGWFREKVDQFVVWAKEQMGIRLTQEEAARALLRDIRSPDIGAAKRTGADYYSKVDASNGIPPMSAESQIGSIRYKLAPTEVLDVRGKPVEEGSVRRMEGDSPAPKLQSQFVREGKMMSDFIPPSHPIWRPKQGASAVEYNQRFFSKEGIEALRESFAGDKPPEYVNDVAAWQTVKDLLESVRRGDKLSIQDLLATNQKTGDYSLDFPLSTCMPSVNCGVCYAAAQPYDAIPGSRVRKALVMAMETEKSADAIASVMKRIKKNDLPVLRINGAGDVTMPWQVDLLNRMIPQLDRPMHIFSRSHVARTAAGAGLDQVSNGWFDPKNPKNGCAVYKMMSIDSQLVKEYGVKFLKNNLKERGGVNSYLAKDADDIPIMLDLKKNGVDFIVHPDTSPGLISAMDKAGLLATEANTKSYGKLVAPICPCATNQKSLANACPGCLTDKSNCFAIGESLAMSEDGKLMSVVDVVEIAKSRARGKRVVPMSEVGAGDELARPFQVAKTIKTYLNNNLAKKIKAFEAGDSDGIVVTDPVTSNPTAKLTGNEAASDARAIFKNWMNIADKLVSGSRLGVKQQRAAYAAEDQIAAADRAAEWARGKQVSSKIMLKRAAENLTDIEPRAQGGPVIPGKTYLAGEAGPEAFVTPAGLTTIDVPTIFSPQTRGEIVPLGDLPPKLPGAADLMETPLPKANDASSERTLIEQAIANPDLKGDSAKVDHLISSTKFSDDVSPFIRDQMKQVLMSEGWRWTNKKPFEDNPNDPGGPTKYGVTMKYDEDDIKGLGKSHVKDLTIDDAARIYDKRYYRNLGLDKLADDSPGLTQMLVDTAIQNGPSFAMDMVRGLMNGASPEDVGAAKIFRGGSLKSDEVAKIRNMDQDERVALLEKMMLARVARAQSRVKANPNLAENERGWINRAREIRQQSAGGV